MNRRSPLRAILILPIFACLHATLYAQESVFSVVETDEQIDINYRGGLILTYHKAIVPPPPGVDPVYARSGFIHPIYTPSGTVVTGIHPEDHYHHLGLWHAWVKCEWNGRHIDFWNLKAKEGAVRFSKTLRLLSPESGDHAGFVVMQEHVAYLPDQEKSEVILREELKVRATLVDGALEIDYDTVQTNVSKHALVLPQYRYGGPIAYRAPHHWDNTNSDYLSSEGKTRVDGHTTRSKWCAFWGPAEIGDMNGSLAILCHRRNYDFPQRMRVWPPETNNGAIFFNYVPIQEVGWSISPGQTSVMRYRLVVADGKPDADDLNARWKKFSP